MPVVAGPELYVNVILALTTLVVGGLLGGALRGGCIRRGRQGRRSAPAYQDMKNKFA